MAAWETELSPGICDVLLSRSAHVALMGPKGHLASMRKGRSSRGSHSLSSPRADQSLRASSLSCPLTTPQKPISPSPTQSACCSSLRPDSGCARHQGERRRPVPQSPWLVLRPAPNCHRLRALFVISRLILVVISGARINSYSPIEFRLFRAHCVTSIHLHTKGI